MSTHLIAASTATASAVFPAAPGWLALSGALTREVPVIADRDDLIVSIAPGAGHGAPACFLPHQATIEVDGTHLGSVDPGTAEPHVTSDRDRYKTAWGLLTHECAHAQHSQWETPDDTPPAIADAAELLEESRIEAAQIRRRPDDRHWLRASATNLILNDTRANDPTNAPQMTVHDAARAAALLLARTDGGILTRPETGPVARVVRTVLGADRLATLRALWRKAHKVADNDATTMIDLGRQWCEAVGTDPNDPSQPDPASTSGPSNGTATPSPLAAAINASVRRVSAAVAHEKVPTDPATQAAQQKATERAANQAAQNAAQAVFTGIGSGSGLTTTAGTRTPTSAERAAARTLARAVDTAGSRERVATKTTSAMPPGRLRMRGALAADAQRAAGALPTAEPFTHTVRRAVPTPPLRIGIACDVSGSIGDYAKPVASTAWILAQAAHHAKVPADTATVIFGHHVRPITRPGTTPKEVTEFSANDMDHDIPTAIDALDGALGLSQPGAARLLVIVSDGHYGTDHRRDGQKRQDRLRATGCAVLWLTPNSTADPIPGATVHQLSDPTTTAQAIGRAATAALRATH